MSNDSPSGQFNMATLPADWAKPTEPAAAAAGSRVVELTDSAETEVRRLITEEGKPGLRLAIKGGGCSGLTYEMEFTEEAEGDTIVEFEGFKVFLDRKSTIYLSGVTLDHQAGLDGRGFVFQNPQASNTCGCGESFSL
jgi:iron-sulfur cluster assembly protein